MAMHLRQRLRRAGFTLTEMIVATGIILILATIAAALIPSLRSQERAVRGANQLQRWLLIAKQRALADRAETGLRLILDPDNSGFVTELVYIQTPEPYTKGVFQRGGQGASSFQGAEFTGGLTTPEDFPIQPGDYLEVYGGGLVTQITRVTDANNLLHLGTTPSTGPTSNYRIRRQPRLLKGEDPVKLPKDIGIDMARSPNVPTRIVGPPGPNAPRFQEVLFSPDGGVVGKGTTGDKIIFWVRDYTADTPTSNSPSLVVIYTRTGLIAVHPVDTTPNGDPYSFAREPRSSGL